MVKIVRPQKDDLRRGVLENQSLTLSVDKFMLLGAKLSITRSCRLVVSDSNLTARGVTDWRNGS
jgi:hypothetical protein